MPFGKILWSDFLIDFLYFNNQTALLFSKAVLFFVDKRGGLCIMGIHNNHKIRNEEFL